MRDVAREADVAVTTVSAHFAATLGPARFGIGRAG